MKKFAFLSYILCLALLLQCAAVPAAALEADQTVPVASEESTSQDEFVETEIPFGSVCVQEGCRTIEAMKPLGGSDRKVPTAQAAMIYEVNTGTMIYSYNADGKLAPGTLTKIVTALVTIENCELDEVVTCSDGIQSKIPYGSQNVKLKSGEQLTVKDLLHCLLLQSANDAAVALAEHVSGTTENFRALMNARVKQMGCTGTEFGNISGLDNAVSYTTARDMAKIIVEATKNEAFVELFGTTSYTVPATNLSDERSFDGLNYLMENPNVTKYYDDRVTGGYPSFITSLGASLVCTAEKKGMKLVCVVLNATRTYYENGWQVDSYGNFDEMVDLLEFAFNNYKVAQVLYEGQALHQFSVAGGECDVVGAPHVNISSVLPNDAYMKNLILNVDTGGSLAAPIARDEKIATVEINYGNVCLMEAELYAMSDVQAADSVATFQGTASKTDSDSGGALAVIGVVCVVILGGFGVYLVYNNIRRARLRRQRQRRRASRRRSY